MADANGLLVGADEGDLGNVNGGLNGFDAACGASPLVLTRLDVLLDAVDSLDDDAVSEDRQDDALLAPVARLDRIQAELRPARSSIFFEFEVRPAITWTRSPFLILAIRSPPVPTKRFA